MTRRTLRKALLDVLAVVGLVAVPVQLGWLGWEVWPDPTVRDFDARQVWHQADAIRTGRQLYRPIPGYGPDTMHGGRYPVEYGPYPPLLASVVALLPATDRVGFDRAWYAALLLGLWGYAAALGLLATGRLGWREAGVGHAVILLTPGAWFGLEIGNADPILWSLYGFALASPLFLGGGLALVAAVKPFAIFPLAFAAQREGRPVLLSAGCAALVGTMICWLALGARLPTTVVDWFRYVPPDLSQGTWAIRNYSLSFLPLKVLRSAGWDPGPGRLPPLAHLWVAVAGVAAPIATGWLTRRFRPAVQYGATFVAALLFAPVFWIQYLPYVLAPLAAGLTTARSRISPGPPGCCRPVPPRPRAPWGLRP